MSTVSKISIIKGRFQLDIERESSDPGASKFFEVYSIKEV